ncbi:hypothetical protein [Micromonospora parathelypteridis]|uniref:Uncharacterized protein n=1 Tax=Micromonospora parathelypteridis TaxID=1839617 RepID=A0A840W1B7_9ACTN|nr:hypothetical protein [Micromonospora parathelypteridis]MBB5478978.1 hypothetical protein [Micromonospora parathelypteridis]GGO03654.1 hypothetical protein GCM10011576_04250 [Micromonospora parathelypteridis]
MTHPHPQPPVGPQYRQQSNPEPPTHPFVATPQPPFSGAAYPVAGGGHPGAGGPAARVPGYPLIAPPPARTNASKKTAVVVAVTAAVLTLLCCAGGIVALVIGANRADGISSNAIGTSGTGKP